jgi:hypothetical protein
MRTVTQNVRSLGAGNDRRAVKVTRMTQLRHRLRQTAISSCSRLVGSRLIKSTINLPAGSACDLFLGRAAAAALRLRSSARWEANAREEGQRCRRYSPRFGARRRGARGSRDVMRLPGASCGYARHVICFGAPQSSCQRHRRHSKRSVRVDR